MPHYAVPMPHRLRAPAALARAPRAGEEALAELAADSLFDVLDIAGDWCWGELAGQGLVGYLPAELLEPLA